MSKKKNTQKRSKLLEDFISEIELLKKNQQKMSDKEKKEVLKRISDLTKQLTPFADQMSKLEKGLLDRGIAFVLDDVVDPIIRWAKGGKIPPVVDLFLKGVGTLLTVFI